MRNQDAAGVASWFSRSWAAQLCRAALGGREGRGPGSRAAVGPAPRLRSGLRQRMCTFVEPCAAGVRGPRGGKRLRGAGFTKVHVRVSGGVQAPVRTYGPECRADQCRGKIYATSPESYAAGISACWGGKSPWNAGFTKVHILANVGGEGQERNRGRGRAETWRQCTTGNETCALAAVPSTQQAFPGLRGREKSPWQAGSFTKQAGAFGVNCRGFGAEACECVLALELLIGQCRRNECALSSSPYAAGRFRARGPGKAMGRGFCESAHSCQRRGRGQERNRGRGRAETRAGTTGTNVHLPRDPSRSKRFTGPAGPGKALTSQGAGFRDESTHSCHRTRRRAGHPGRGRTATRAGTHGTKGHSAATAGAQGEAGRVRAHSFTR